MRLDNPAIALALGDRDPEKVEAVCSGLKQWIGSDGKMSLHQALGLRTPLRTREDIRNLHLVEAARLLPGNPTQRAETLVELIRAFNVRRWPAWHHLPTPPPEASEIDRLLWECMRLGVTLPESKEQVYRIIGAF